MSQAIGGHAQEKMTLCPELREVDNALKVDAMINTTKTADT